MPHNPKLDTALLVDQAFHSDNATSKDLKARHISMIALGGAIGTGLFLGAGSRLQAAGPSLLFIYALCGLCAFMVLRALGQLMMHRPSSGGFVSYTREFLGEGAAYAMGWFYLLNLLLTGIADISAVGMFMHYWPAFAYIPQWVIALVALVIISLANLIGVKWFGEAEFWLSMLKVAAIAIFLAVGVIILVCGYHVGTYQPGIHLITENGGFFPHGWVAPLLLVQGVIFAYATTEILGVAVGECRNPREVIKGAVNGVAWRIAIFYVGSVALLTLLLPWTMYKGSESPFVTFFSVLGIHGMGSIMNIVMVSAAFSSLNTLLYLSGRILRGLALGGSAPKAFTKLNAKKLPYVGLYASIVVFLLGVGLNYLLPTYAFELALSVASIGLIVSWAFILLSQIKMHKLIKAGKMEKAAFPMPFAPYSGYLTLAFLLAVVVLIGFDYPMGTYTIATLPIVAVMLFVGWHFIKRSK